MPELSAVPGGCISVPTLAATDHHEPLTVTHQICQWLQNMHHTDSSCSNDPLPDP